MKRSFISEYFISLDGKVQQGPFKLEEVNKKFSRDEISIDSLFWHQGLEGWVKAKEIPELKELLQNLPPPLDDSMATDTPPPLSVKEESHGNKSGSSSANHDNFQETRDQDTITRKKSGNERIAFDENGLTKSIRNAFFPSAEFIGTDFGIILISRSFIYGFPLSILFWWVLGRPEHLPEMAFSYIPVAVVAIATIFKRARGLKGKIFGWISVIVSLISLYLGGPILCCLFLIYLRFAKPNSLDKGGYHCLKEFLAINAETTENDRNVLFQLLRDEDLFRRDNGIPHRVALAPYRVGVHNEVKGISPAVRNVVFSWMFSTNGCLYDGQNWNECSSEDKRASETFKDGNEDLRHDLLRLRDCVANGRFLIEKNGIQYEVRDLDGVLKFFGMNGDSRDKVIEGCRNGRVLSGPIVNGWQCRRDTSP